MHHAILHTLHTPREQTPLLPSAEVCKQMCAQHPDFMQAIETHGVQYVRVMSQQDDPSSAIGRGWQSTFLTESKEEAESKLKELGSRFEWLESGDLKTVTSVLPAVRVDAGPRRSNEKTFFNSMVAAYTGRSYVVCCAVLCCAVLCCAVLCCAVLCCADIYLYSVVF